jgi:putative ABC transport system permease protein
MIRNYIKTAFRSLLRNRTYTLINVFGLSTGIAICLVIFVLIRFEQSYDNFHVKKDRIYRVLTEYHHPDVEGVFYGAAAPAPMPTVIKNDFPELKSTTGILASGNDQILVYGENGQVIKKFKEESGLFCVEPAFFDIFDFPWLIGNPATAMKNPNSAVLSQSEAEKYFGDWKKAPGRTIRVNDKFLLKVTGVLAPIPANTDFQIKIIVPYSILGFDHSTDWASSSSSHDCYVLLPPGSSVPSYNARFRAFAKKYFPPEDKDELVIQSLSKVHNYDKYTGNFSGKSVKPEVIRALWLIAAFILLIACVNFINLSTAQAVNRAKEVGVRKVLGSNKIQLKIQFLTETFLMVLFSAVLALGCAAIFLPAISKVLDLPLSASLMVNPFFLGFLSLIIVLVTGLAGFYPSSVLARFSPISALKARWDRRGSGGLSLRRGLVVFQFVIAQALIIGTLIMIRQMDFFRTTSMGFNKESILDVPFPSDSVSLSKLDFLRNKLLSTPGVLNVSFSSSSPADHDNNWSDFYFDHASKKTNFYSINKWVDVDFLSTYQLPLVAGRNFRASDSVKEFIVNETLMRKLGYTQPEKLLNKEINLFDGFIKGPIVGVLKDFHSTSMKDAYSPVLLSKLKPGYQMAGIKMTSTNIPGTLQAVEKLWGELFPEYVFDYQFLDVRIDNFYRQENQLSQLYKIFAGIAIFLSCLGLYGLASFMAVQKIKEVGIRKVLGATVTSILYLFSREFILLIVFAFVIASPIAWLFMHHWLQDYEYRVSMSWWIFLAGGLASLLIALMTVSFQAWKASRANPVTSLRSE